MSTISKRYHPSAWNVYAFHASDGDNFPHDTNDMLSAATKLRDMCQLFGYCEITPEESQAGWFEDGKLSNHLRQLIDRSMKCVEIKNKEDVWKAFKIMFGNYKDKS